MAEQQQWRKPNATQLLLLVCTQVKFVDGVLPHNF